MELNINSPAYFSKAFGVDDAIYSMCRTIRLFVKNRQYSDQIEIIGIMPTVAPKSELDNGGWKEFRKIDRKAKLIIFSKQIDYESFVNGNSEIRKRLILDCLFYCVKSIPKKMNFNKDAFKRDILECVGINDDLE